MKIRNLRTKPTLLALAAPLLLTGCVGTENAVFVTKTSISVLDADTSPPGVSIAHDRVEGYFGPAYSNGAAAPVAAVLQSDGSVINPKIKQLYATGNAAEIVSGHPADTRAVLKGDKRPMFFGTATNIGLKVSFASGSAIPNSLAFGYRRKEASVIPIQKDEANVEHYPSALAMIDNTNTTATKDGTALRVAQVFATGAAAETLASSLRGEFFARVESVAILSSDATEAERLRQMAFLQTLIGEINADASAGSQQAGEIQKKLNSLNLSDLTPPFSAITSSGQPDTFGRAPVAAPVRDKDYYQNVVSYLGNLDRSVFRGEKLSTGNAANLKEEDGAGATKPMGAAFYASATRDLAEQKEQRKKLQEKLLADPAVKSALSYIAQKLKQI